MTTILYPYESLPGEGLEFIATRERTYHFCPTCEMEVKILHIHKGEDTITVCENCFWQSLTLNQTDILDAEFDDGTIVCTETSSSEENQVEIPPDSIPRRI